MRTNPDMEERVEKAEKRKPGSTTLHRESEKDRMDRMRRKLAKKGPATRAEAPRSVESAAKLKYNPMLQPKESAEERKDVEMRPNSEPASGSTENVGTKREREETDNMELDEVRLWEMMGYDETIIRWICQGVGDENKVKEGLRAQLNNVKIW